MNMRRIKYGMISFKMGPFDIGPLQRSSKEYASTWVNNCVLSVLFHVYVDRRVGHSAMSLIFLSFSPPCPLFVKISHMVRRKGNSHLYVQTGTQLLMPGVYSPIKDLFVNLNTLPQTPHKSPYHTFHHWNAPSCSIFTPWIREIAQFRSSSAKIFQKP